MQTVSLTALGRSKAEDITGSGPRQQVMATLYEEGPMNVSEIASSLGMDEAKAAMVVKGLMKDGYVQKSGGLF